MLIRLDKHLLAVIAQSSIGIQTRTHGNTTTVVHPGNLFAPAFQDVETSSPASNKRDRGKNKNTIAMIITEWSIIIAQKKKKKTVSHSIHNND